ncbi:MAG: UDP-N-acetylmuramate dehydrogenase [Candidatus Atribacteria bacterium]|nr:UDP-N-acetylmuramate dehydrogenase [Candidatus Atribacteria bacterium]MCK4308498.1 UDP-N-acetylmuramate dehydrogenase [Candidatus Atribacteria bacterium]
MNIDVINNEFIKKGLEKVVKLNEPLMNHTSLKIGGPADIFCIPNDIEELMKIISISQKFNIPFWVIGNGTNLLVLDKGVRGTVIKLGKGFKKMNFFDKIVKVGSGVSLLYLGRVTLNRGLSGLEFACNIPGTLGGAIINNASFNGNCMADIVQRVTFLTKEKKIESVPPPGLNFKYRECNLKGKSVIILEVTLQLKEGNKEKIESIIKEYIKIREVKQPVDKLSAGSIFKNPPGYYAGELIEKIGAKGLSQGKASVSNKHANFIINNGNATARDVLYLIEEIEKRVRKAFNIELNREIQILGEP